MSEPKKKMNLVQLTFIVAVNMLGSGIIMLPTIAFNNDSLFKTNEIGDIRSYRRLPAEFDAFESFSSKEIPKPSFGIGAMIS